MIKLAGLLLLLLLLVLLLVVVLAAWDTGHLMQNIAIKTIEHATKYQARGR